MPAYILDTSALVKRWIEEPGSTRVRQLTALDTQHHVYVARLAITEVVGAVTRRHLAAHLPPAARQDVVTLIRREIRERVRVIVTADREQGAATRHVGLTAEIL